MRLLLAAALLAWTPCVCALLVPSSLPLPLLDLDAAGGEVAFLGQYDGILLYDYANKSSAAFDSPLLLYLGFPDSSTPGGTKYARVGALTTNLLALPVTQLTPVAADTLLMLGNFSLTLGSSSYSPPLLFNTTSGSATELDPNGDIDGYVETGLVYGDAIYLGGAFVYNSTDHSAVLYNTTTNQLQALPFRGFGSASVVHAIVLVGGSSSGNSSTDALIVFGGEFDTLGLPQLLNHTFTNTTVHNTSNSSVLNTTWQVDQVVSLRHATLSMIDNGNTSAVVDGSVFTCPNSGVWVLLEGSDSTGQVLVSLPFTVYPSKIRIYNADVAADGGAVLLFRLLTLPTNGIMNLTYIEPETGELAYCDAWCPLANLTLLAGLEDEGLSVSFGSVNGLELQVTSQYQEFGFVNDVLVQLFTLTVLDHYGSRAALAGFQVFQPYIFAYANDTLNDFSLCEGSGTFSSLLKEVSGSWYAVGENDGSLGPYLAANVLGGAAEIEYQPNITFNGQYLILMYTPGCAGDGSCESRGLVNVTVYSGLTDEPLGEPYTVWQNNMYQKFDQVFYGSINVTNLSDLLSVYRPYVRMLYVEGSASLDSAVVVAYRLRIDIDGINDEYFNATNSTNTTRTTLMVPLNGVFEYSLANFSSFSLAALTNNSASGNLSSGYNYNRTRVFVGNLSLNQFGALLDEGARINGLAWALLDVLVCGGDFQSEEGLHLVRLDIALDAFNTSSNSTAVQQVQLVGGGLDAPVSRLVPMGGSVVALGNFSAFNTSGLNLTVTTLEGNSTSDLDGVLIYNTSSSMVLTLGASISAVDFTNATINGTSVYVITSQSGGVLAYDVALEKFLTLGPTVVNVTKAVAAAEWLAYVGNLSVVDLAAVDGAVLDDTSSGLTALLAVAPNTLVLYAPVFSSYVKVNSLLAVLGGRFTDGEVQNVALVQNGTTSALHTISWRDSLVVNVFAADENYLFVGFYGAALVSEQVLGGLAVYSLANHTFVSLQPAAMSSSSGTVLVRALAYHTLLQQLLVGGNFTQAGSLACAGVCLYDTGAEQWNLPFTSTMLGEVYVMQWISLSKVLVAGNMTIAGLLAVFATYDFGAASISAVDSLNNGVPGTIRLLVRPDASDNLIGSRVIGAGDGFVAAHTGGRWVRIDGDLDMAQSTVNDLVLLPLNSSNSNNNQLYFDRDEVLVASGVLEHAEYGTLLAAWFNGSAWLPYLVLTWDGEHGLVHQVVVNATELQYGQSSSKSGTHHWSSGKVIGALFGFAAATMVVALLLIAGYVYLDKRLNGGMGDIHYMLRVDETEMLNTVNPGDLMQGMSYAKQAA